MVDIKTKLHEELDYKIELSNQLYMDRLWFNDINIKIPKIIPELCNDKILGMHYIDADNLSYFINNSTQEEKNNIAKILIKFIFTNIYKHKIFYSDIHYGNFLIKNKEELYVMDFGCLIKLDDDLHSNLLNLHLSIINENIDLFYTILEKMKIMNESISEKSKIYLYEYFKLQYTPLICENFEFTEEWIKKSDYKDTELMKEWNLPPNIVYLNKILY
jgi:predicted unusual protein kinase regulating ubiquinone biosynthesis (AarF/ABC1/UbiB family)